LRAWTAPDGGARKLLTKVLQILPSGKRDRKIRPFNETLENRVRTLGDGTVLKNAFGNTPEYILGQRHSSDRMASTDCLLQLRNVKNRVHRRRGRELKPVCHGAHPGSDTVWSKKLEGELLITALSQGSLNVWLNLDVNMVTNLELTL
jgi:hypothetical protein